MLPLRRVSKSPSGKPRPYLSYEGGLLGYRHKSFPGCNSGVLQPKNVGVGRTRSPFSPAPRQCEKCKQCTRSRSVRGTQSGAFKKRYVRFHRFSGNHVSLRDVWFLSRFSMCGNSRVRRLRTTPMRVRGNWPRLAVVCGSRSITG